MKMWYCTLFFLIVIISVWFLSFGIMKSDHLNVNAAIEVNIVQNSGEDLMKNESETNVISRGKMKYHIPKFMLELYEKSKNIKKNEYNHMHPDIVKSVIPIHSKTQYSYMYQQDVNTDNHVLVFNIPNSHKDELFINAELRVLTLVALKSNIELGLERRITVSLLNETTKEFKLLENRHIYHSDNTWISFNVTNVVQKILKSFNNEKFLKLVITVKSIHHNQFGTFKLSLMPLEENLEHDYPILLLFYVSEKRETNSTDRNSVNNHQTVPRRKRNIEEDYEEETNRIWDDDSVTKVSKRIKRMRNNCKKKPLYIDFAEIQYDSWIVQPNGYEAYQCAGKCFYPVAEHLSPTKHAIVQALLHSLSPSKAPRSCCVPTKLDSISVLYVDAQGVLTYRYAYKDMVVTECGCR